MKRLSDARPHLPGVFLLSALAAALFWVGPGSADIGAARAAAVLTLSLLALWGALPVVAARPPSRIAAAALGAFVLVTLVSVLRSGDVLAAFWGRPVFWTASGSLLLALAAAVPAAGVPAARRTLPVGIVASLSLHQASLLLHTFFPSWPLPSGDVLSFAAAVPTHAALLSLPAIVIAAAALVRAGQPPASRALWVASALLHLAVLVRVDRGLVWGVLCLGLVVLLAAALRRFGGLWRPGANAVFALAAVSLLLAVVRLPAPLVATVPAEVDLRPMDVLAAAPGLWRQDPLAAVFGSGPGTFLDAFGRVRPASLNGPAIWNVRFPVAPNVLLQWLYDLGLAGLAASLVLVGVSLVSVVRTSAAVPAARGVRRAFARRTAPADDVGLAAAGMAALVVALVAAAAWSMVPPAGLFVSALGVGWLLGARPETEKPAKTEDGRRALLLGWTGTALLVLAAIALAATVWSCVAGRAFGAVLRSRTPDDAEAAYAAALGRTPPPEIHAVGALVALERAAAAEDPTVALDAALVRARLAASSGRASLLEAAVTVGMQAVRAGRDVPELDAWIAAARAAEPANPTFPIALGDLRSLRGDAAGAEEAYRAAVGLAPAVFPARARLVALLIETGRTDEAVAAAEDGVRAAPLDAAPLTLLAGVLTGRGADGDLAAAETLARRAAQLLGGDPTPLIRIAELLEQKGENAAAQRWYEAAAALAPDNRELRARIDRLQGATSTPAEPVE